MNSKEHVRPWACLRLNAFLRYAVWRPLKAWPRPTALRAIFCLIRMCGTPAGGHAEIVAAYCGAGPCTWAYHHERCRQPDRGQPQYAQGAFPQTGGSGAARIAREERGVWYDLGRSRMRKEKARFGGLQFAKRYHEESL